MAVLGGISPKSRAVERKSAQVPARGNLVRIPALSSHVKTPMLKHDTVEDIFMRGILIAVQAGLLTFVAVVGAYSDGDDPAKCPAVEIVDKLHC